MDLIGLPKHKKTNKKNSLLTRVSSSKVDGHRPARFLWFYQWLSVALINVSAENLSRFSAVCWLFGRYLHKSLKYPIGLVESCYGGTPVEAWSSSRVLQQCGLEHSTWGEEEVVVVNSSSCLPGSCQIEGFTLQNMQKEFKGRQTSDICLVQNYFFLNVMHCGVYLRFVPKPASQE